MATGETARRRDPSTLDELTPQELQIALLLAEGRKTTRQAAAALGSARETIEYHLRHVYSKLGIRSREQLAAAFAGQARARRQSRMGFFRITRAPLNDFLRLHPEAIRALRLGT